MINTDNELSNLIHNIALDGFSKEGGYSFEENKIFSRIKNLGSELWIDSGDRDRASALWKKELSALTTNNTLANQVVQTGIMDDEIRNAVQKIKEKAPAISEDGLVFEVGFVINCKIALRLVKEFDVKVSIELHPALSRDKERTIAYAKRYYKICPENFIVKIPLTPEGYLAVRELRKEGIPINFTLGFSARQNYLAAHLSNPDYVNIFLGRLNAVVSDNAMGDGNYVGEAVAIASQKAIDELKRVNPAINTRQIAASIRNWQQVITLSGIDVQTIPPKAVEDLLSSDADLSTVESCKYRELEIGIERPYLERFNLLWQVDTRFKQFVDRLLKEDIDNLTGDDLIAICKGNDIDLFYRFTDSDLNSIKEHGKIPKLGRWNENIALDDLMTVSALQSFAKDQEELDNRIKGMVR
ncbi:MAG: transaldolase family protein [Thermodesulfobacteriota bacterium]